ncbi:MAG: bifunctional phosphoribosylaminoimidazolecarboxamide formyltransferase/IMP cyclohydrolase [Paracoccaceae bacterium]
MKTDLVKIKRAIISVSNKDGLEELALKLRSWDVDLIASGGTANILKEKRIEVIELEDLTGFPELLGGRVKSLHPKIHGGILALRDNPNHISDLKKHKIMPIDLVICDLYPFEEFVQKKESHISCLENIDIGGITLIRAAAKNYKYVTVISNSSGYFELLTHLDENNGNTSAEFRFSRAIEAFSCSSNYDHQVSSWLQKSDSGQFPKEKEFSFKLNRTLSYGENQHQNAAFYHEKNMMEWSPNFTQHQGKPLSYNNFLDLDSGLGLLESFRNQIKPFIGIIKHTNPCGVASGDTVLDAFDRSFQCDPMSAFGGIIVSNTMISVLETKRIMESFFEIIIAPAFHEDSLKLFSEKPNLRVISIGQAWKSMQRNKFELRSIYSGFLYQERDNHEIEQKDLKLVTQLSPKNNQIKDLLFAWKVVKHVKSNGIVFVKNEATVGIGSGQPSRIDSTVIAINKSDDMYKKQGLFSSPLKGASMASDAFFPFADSLNEAVSRGVKSVIQPGGSIRDKELIKLANKKGISMVFTGIRAFKH